MEWSQAMSGKEIWVVLLFIDIVLQYAVVDIRKKWHWQISVSNEHVQVQHTFLTISFFMQFDVIYFVYSIN